MSSLRELQLAFSGSVLGEAELVFEDLAAPPAGDRADRVDIYREGYRLRLIGSLATDYPATKTLLGEDRFGQLARAFVEAYPSPFFNLRWYGAEFADFIGRQGQRDDTPAARLAAFEWAIAGAFDGADAKPVTVEDLARIPPEAWPDLRFELHPTVRRLEVPGAVPGTWKAAVAGESLPAPVPEDVPSAWIVWRKDLAVLYRPADPDEVEALDQAACGANFAEVCAGLSGHVSEPETAMRAAVLLRRWVEEGLIAGLHCGSR